MSQKVMWHCAECDAVVMTTSEDGNPSCECPNCGTPKEASGRGSQDGVDPHAYDARAGARFAEMAGPELDRALARRVLGGPGEIPVPPYSSEDWAAMALAELVGRQSSWSFHLSFCGNAWMATFTERGTPKSSGAAAPVASFVSATGRSRALAIARALLKVVRCPRWMPLGDSFLTSGLSYARPSA
jgi:hypothetical protein